MTRALARVGFIVVALFQLFGCATTTPAPLNAWDAEAIAKMPNTAMRLHGREPGQAVIATVSTARVRSVVEIAKKIQEVAGISARVYVTDGTEPNAFSTSKNGQNFIGVNLPMLDLLADDRDATAALIGHETAHLALEHRSAREDRENVRAGTSQVLAVLLARVVPFSGAVASVATTAVERTYTRDEERDADQNGINYARQAGFDPMGAVRLWERMSQRSSTNSLAFLSTHPASEERLSTMRRLAGQPAP